MSAWYPCFFISGIGFLILALSYGCLIAGKRSKKHISGIPFFGGLLIAAGFLLSPRKWLALLGLTDYSYWMLLYCLISEQFGSKRKTIQNHQPEP